MLRVWECCSRCSKASRFPEIPRTGNLNAGLSHRLLSRVANVPVSDQPSLSRVPLKDQASHLEGSSTNLQRRMSRGAADSHGVWQSLLKIHSISSLRLETSSFAKFSSDKLEDFDILEKAVRAMVEELDTGNRMPTARQLFKAKQTGIYQAILKHGGMASVAKRLGLKATKPRGYWSDDAFVIQQLKKFMEAHSLTTMPSQKYLTNNDARGLLVAINKRGGLKRYAGLLGFQCNDSLRSQGVVYKNNFKLLEADVLSVIDKAGTPGVFPTFELLEKMSRLDLQSGIHRYHGGRKKVAARMGLTFIE